MFCRSSPSGDLEGWIMSQLLMIVSVHVASCDAKVSAGEDLGLGIGGVQWISRNGNGLVDSVNEIGPAIDLA